MDALLDPHDHVLSTLALDEDVELLVLWQDFVAVLDDGCKS